MTMMMRAPPRPHTASGHASGSPSPSASRSSTHSWRPSSADDTVATPSPSTSTSPFPSPTPAILSDPTGPEQYELQPTRLSGANSNMTTPDASLLPNHDHHHHNDDHNDSSAIHLLNQRTVRKLDLILLPFLALLFLFNSLDRSNIGNAETAHFTRDIGLDPADLNHAVSLCFAFFVALQPVGAALGRRVGVARWVPACMSVWGLCTVLHAWVRARWQLYVLRIVIGTLEAGFYPVAVSYLSLFYARDEYATRLALFYGQSAISGALGGLLSYLVFSRFPNEATDATTEAGRLQSWRPWQVLFLVEGCSTVLIALVGFFWLPHSPGTAWFLSKEERRWAERRIQQDRAEGDMDFDERAAEHADDESNESIEGQGLLSHRRRRSNSSSSMSPPAPDTTDRGLTSDDILTALLDWKIWHLLGCNILASIPTTAFAIFLPLIITPLAPAHHSPALTNLLTAPPHLLTALTLYLVAAHSDRTRRRLRPILLSLSLTLLLLLLLTLLPTTSHTLPRYLTLLLLLPTASLPSPLTIAWLTDNTPSPSLRACRLGINGWGNLAGFLAPFVFHPRFAPAYRVSFAWAALASGGALVGYALFVRRLRAENMRRREAGERRRVSPAWWVRKLADVVGMRGRVARWSGGLRSGDERVGFLYGF